MCSIYKVWIVPMLPLVSSFDNLKAVCIKFFFLAYYKNVTYIITCLQFNGTSKKPDLLLQTFWKTNDFLGPEVSSSILYLVYRLYLLILELRNSELCSFSLALEHSQDVIQPASFTFAGLVACQQRIVLTRLEKDFEHRVTKRVRRTKTYCRNIYLVV